MISFIEVLLLAILFQPHGRRFIFLLINSIFEKSKSSEKMVKETTEKLIFELYPVLPEQNTYVNFYHFYCKTTRILNKKELWRKILNLKSIFNLKIMCLNQNLKHNHNK